MVNRIAILSLLVAVMITRGSYADESERYEGRLEETIVTATGFEDSQNNQIKNITIITNRDIINKGYNSVEEVLRKAPGVNFYTNQFGAMPDIRGQGYRSPTGSGLVGRVKILVDGVAMNLLDLSHAVVPINTIPVENIERIEIINGGGSVLYGSGTSGGVINIITKKDKSERTFGKVYYQNSSFNTNKLGFGAGLRVIDNFLINLGYENIDGKSYRKGDEKSSEFLNGGFTYDISDNQTLKFKASRYSDEFNQTGALTLAQTLDDRRQAGTDTFNGFTDRKEYTLTYNYKPSKNMEFSIIGFNQKTTRDYDQITSRIIYTDGLFVDKKIGGNFKGIYNYGSGNVIFGYDYTDNDMLRQAIINMRMTVGGRPITRNISNTVVDLSKKTNSAFLLGRHEFTDKWEGTLGYRYERAKFSIKRSDGTYSLETETEENNNAYEAGINFKYSNTGNVYAKYERGFRSPSPTEMINKDTLTGKGYYTNDTKSEKYDTYEIGMKDMIGNSFISLTGFYTKTNDEVLFISTGGSPLTGTGWKYSNIEKTERKGIELFSEQYFGKLRVNESINYVNAKISKGEDKGKKIPYVASTKATLGLSYDISSEFSIATDINYFSNARDGEGNKIKAYSTTDISGNYKYKGGLGIQAGIKNVFAKKYYEFQSGNSYKPAAERTYFLGVNYEF